MQNIKVLIVDDEKTFRSVLAKEITGMGNKTFTAEDGVSALSCMERENIDVIILDLKMPGRGGVEILKEIKEINPVIEVIILTGYAEIDSAISCMKLGAYDYLTKPLPLEELEILLKKAKEKKDLNCENLTLKQIIKREKHPEIIGTSKKIQEIKEIIKKISPADSPVLIQGETGTGKELLARQIHEKSLRCNDPFLVINCGALQETLLESELFGYEKGAFTGAVSRKLGLFEVADKGTLFLDEVGELPPSIQVKILRICDLGEFRKIGGLKNIKCDVRIISATNKDLEKLVKENKFREDLFYRLNLVTINVPPLRERKEDLEDLINCFLKSNKITNKKNIQISDKIVKFLENYDFPGNIRELQNIIERAIIISENEEIQITDLPLNVQNYNYNFEGKFNKKDASLKEIEKEYILQVLKKTNDDKQKASEILDISLKTLYNKLKEYKINL